MPNVGEIWFSFSKALLSNNIAYRLEYLHTSTVDLCGTVTNNPLKL